MTNDDRTVLIDGLSKKYGKSIDYAIEDISFECYTGEIVGLLGKNGAGKSTIIKCLTGFLPFDKGVIEINGKDIVKKPVEAKRNFGYVPDNRNVFEKMTGMEYINFMADAYRVSAELREARIVEFQKAFDLGDKIFNLINSYSHGMKQKICIMGSLIAYPKLWILDEPITGLDPQTAMALRNYMKSYAERGNTVLFSSHNLDAVEKTCDRIVVIKQGRVVANTVVAAFKAEHPGTSLEDYFISEF